MSARCERAQVSKRQRHTFAGAGYCMCYAAIVDCRRNVAWKRDEQMPFQCVIAHLQGIAPLASSELVQRCSERGEVQWCCPRWSGEPSTEELAAEPVGRLMWLACAFLAARLIHWLLWRRSANRSSFWGALLGVG